MAKYMIEHGARNIVLVSRSGGGRELVEQLKHETQCHDARIMTLKCDASVESQVRRLVGDCAATLPPICGVIHAAMVLRVSHGSMLSRNSKLTGGVRMASSRAWHTRTTNESSAPR